jgi:hypothetical protein
VALGRANLKPSQSKLSPSLQDRNIRGDLFGLNIAIRHNHYIITIYGRIPTKMQRRLRLGAPGDTSFMLNARRALHNGSRSCVHPDLDSHVIADLFVRRRRTRADTTPDGPTRQGVTVDNSDPTTGTKLHRSLIVRDVYPCDLLN